MGHPETSESVVVDAQTGAPTKTAPPKPSFFGKCDIYGDLHDRRPDEHAYETTRATWRDLFAVKDGAAPPAEMLEDIDAYLEPFASPIFVDGKTMCPHCGHPFNGSMLDSLLGEGGFEWGLAHGEGHCRCCRWPARLYHFVKDRHGEELMTFRHLVIAYRPMTVEEIAEAEAAEGMAPFEGVHDDTLSPSGGQTNTPSQDQREGTQ